MEQKLSGELSEVSMPCDLERKSGNRSKRFHFEISRELTNKLCCIEEDKDISVFIKLTAAINILLYKYTNQNDILVGIPLLDGIQEFYSCVQGKMTVRDFLENVTREITTNYRNQYCPVDRTSLFKAISIYKDIHNINEDEICHLENDLVFYFFKTDGCITAQITYNSNKFKNESIIQFKKSYLYILEQLLSNQDIQIARVELIKAEEREKIIKDFNDTTVAYPESNISLHKMFEKQTALTPDNTAVSCVSEHNGKCVAQNITFKELNEKSNRLARLLRKKGVRPNSIIAIMPRQSYEMVVGILAVLKAGGAYLPIDPDYPQNRINLILEDSETNMLLTHSDIADKVKFIGEIIHIDNEEMYHINDENLEEVNKPEDLACVIYTSGSTGTPKGVLVKHINMVNFSNWRIGNYNYNTKDVSLQLLSVAFDGFGSIFYSSLLSGGTLVIIEEENRINYSFIRNVLEDRSVTNMCLVPSMYRAILDGAKREQLSNVRFVTLAGEKADESLIDMSNYINPEIVISNEYGPTENTIATTSYKGMTRDTTSIIGKPISNHSVFIVNRDLNLVPAGVPGELCVSGAGITGGYLKRPQLTEEKFISIQINNASITIYRTGDMAKWHDDGNIEFLGRADYQVKIRGFRIELGEIENSLLSYEPVKECIVMVNEDTKGSKYICAYIVSERELTAVELRDYLSSMLPEYMIPSQYIKLAEVPLMQNGKADRNALAKYTVNIATGVEYSAPVNIQEEKLTAVWQEVLGLEKIGVNDRFFDIGGDSMKAVKISELCLENGIKISAKDIFTHKTIAKLVQNVNFDTVNDNHHNTDTIFNEQAGTKKLKINLQREITTYLHRSLPLCAILSCEENYKWFYQHYIEIFSITYQNGFSRLEFLEEKNNYDAVFHEAFLKFEEVPDILQFIKDKIDSGVYVSVHIDEYCLPQKGSYGKNHFVHPSLIYGYDNIQNKLMAIGFDSEMIFNEITFDFNDFVEAYESAKIHYGTFAPWAETEAVQLLIPREFDKDYKLDLESVLVSIDNYLTSSAVNSDKIVKLVSTDEMNTFDQLKYGIDVYDVIVQSLEKLGSDIIKGLDVQNIIEQCKEKAVADIMPSMDYRSMHLLYEHKKGIYNRIRYIIDNFGSSKVLNQLADKYLKIIEKLNTARLTFFDLESMFNAGFDPNKINFNELFQSFQQMTAAVKSAGDEEKILLRQIYTEIQNKLNGGR
ncbi:non-ribosomal peptide synthetase [Clostridium sp. BNL1100]|uniref:non-ribosomal peptide synthetase n=1 Tax=Clostridium sp. BNL1100 TaxID=755731 RepID=UPI00024A771D|nr:non-ribosomal peptide synthetase [Clostridium sp. BNL1100]AEY66936.1 amino acid adenylation enzyme/thioester reductase family protein [Clostridium sp. BNL1100]